ncbi:MAG: MnmC family methyltransferase, partial [Aliarcobacter sp.]
MQDNINSMVTTKDGSNTLFSQRYNQHYHNPDDGAINEALTKHIIPTFTFHKEKKELTILDICFGIGYNTFSTIYYVLQNNLDIKLNIYSPELDGNLVKSLEDFPFPKEFDSIKHIINSVAKTSKYEDEKIKIEVFIGDARKYIKSLKPNSFDIVFQDAFSSDVNFELWTKEYFEDIYKITNNNFIMS